MNFEFLFSLSKLLGTRRKRKKNIFLTFAWNSASAAPPSFFHSPRRGPGHSLGARLSTDLGKGRKKGGKGRHLLASREVQSSIWCFF